MASAARPGDWQCPNTGCINHIQFPNAFVFGSKVNCSKCGTGKSATRAGDWCCPNQTCVNHHNTVYGSKQNCSKCGAPKPELNAWSGAAPGSRGAYASHMPTGLNMLIGPTMPAMPTQAMPCGGAGVGRGGVPMPRIGDWHCANPQCKNHTDNVVFASKTTCPICGMEKPAPPPMPVGVSSPPPPPHGHGWAAPVNHYMPQATNAYDGAMKQGRPKAQPGDWHCADPSCKNHSQNFVYASKQYCPICNMPKPTDEGGGEIEPMMTPKAVLSRPGDWQCPNANCKNHMNGVYGSKAACSLCGAPSPEAADRQRSRSPRQA